MSQSNYRHYSHGEWCSQYSLSLAQDFSLPSAVTFTATSPHSCHGPWISTHICYRWGHVHLKPNLCTISTQAVHIYKPGFQTLCLKPEYLLFWSLSRVLSYATLCIPCRELCLLRCVLVNRITTRPERHSPMYTSCFNQYLFCTFDHFSDFFEGRVYGRMYEWTISLIFRANIAK